MGRVSVFRLVGAGELRLHLITTLPLFHHYRGIPHLLHPHLPLRLHHLPVPLQRPPPPTKEPPQHLPIRVLLTLFIHPRQSTFYRLYWQFGLCALDATELLRKGKDLGVFTCDGEEVVGGDEVLVDAGDRVEDIF